MIPIPIALGQGKFLYINTEESILCLDQARQYYFTTNEIDLKLCKVINTETYICRQRHPLLSSHLLESCAVKMLQLRRTIPKSCETRVVQLPNTVWTELRNNVWIYFAPHTDTMTILCKDGEPIDIALEGVGKLLIVSGCRGYSTSAVLQASSTVMSNLTQPKDLLSQIPLQ